MTLGLVLRSAAVQLPPGEAPAAVCVHEGRIVAIEPYTATISAHEDVDLGGLTLLPGLVDTHVHVNEPGRTEWEGFATATRAAAAGGVTTLIDMPLNSVPPTVDLAALEAKRQAAAGQIRVNVGFWGGAIPGNTGQLATLHEAGVFGFKCFASPSGVDEFPPLPLSLMSYPGTCRCSAALDALLDAGVHPTIHPTTDDVTAAEPARHLTVLRVPAAVRWARADRVCPSDWRCSLSRT